MKQNCQFAMVPVIKEPTDILDISSSSSDRTFIYQPNIIVESRFFNFKFKLESRKIQWFHYQYWVERNFVTNETNAVTKTTRGFI